MKSLQNKIKINLIAGVVLITINTLWTYHFAYYLYSYHFRKEILWCMMYPNWILILNTLLGIMGIVIGIFLLKNQLKLKTCLLIDISILIFGFFLTL